MSASAIDGMLVRGAIGADYHHHAVKLRAVNDVLLKNGDAERVELVMLVSTDAAEGLARQLLAAVASARHSQLLDALAGECENCGNSRFVDEPRAGGSRMEKIHCPECWPRSQRPVPTMAGWAEAERAVL